ncbi:MAG: YraN family protein [Deltaproteobacteria bacterium]|jgi:putative endonuclease|nr:YraN family protein [Deltaproteobacteria bacterium]
MILRQKELGAKGEEIAARYLKNKGYRIIERNYRIRLGEIDIIAEHGQELVFVEVKTRSDVLFGSPFESVTKQKQKQLSKVALDYINRTHRHNRPARFDVVGIEFQEGGNSYQDAKIELLQNAFDLCYSN